MKRAGFTLIEMLLYTAFLTIIAGFFGGILFTTVRVQYKEATNARVSQEAAFALSTIKRLIGASSLIDATAGAATSTLTLRMTDAEKDPTTIYASSTALYYQEGTSAAVAITTSGVTVDSFSFVKYENAPAPDSVRIDMVLSANTANPEQQVTKTFQTSVVRISAATFDSNLVPGSDNAYSFGTASNRWTTGRFSGAVTVEGNLTAATSTNPYTEAIYAWGDVHANGYIQFSKSFAGAPTATDCDSNTERGRLAIDTSNNRLYLCNGATRGWDYVTLTD